MRRRAVNGSDFTINVCCLVRAANLRLPSPAPPRSHLLTTQFFSSLLFSWLSFEAWNFLSRTVWLRSAVLFSLSGRHFFSEQVNFSELQRKTEKRSQLHTNRIVLFNNCLKINFANSVSLHEKEGLSGHHLVVVHQSVYPTHTPAGTTTTQRAMWPFSAWSRASVPTVVRGTGCLLGSPGVPKPETQASLGHPFSSTHTQESRESQCAEKGSRFTKKVW